MEQMNDVQQKIANMAEQIVRKHAEIVCNENVICNYTALANDIAAAIAAATPASTPFDNVPFANETAHERLMVATKLIAEQARDGGLWFIAQTASEAYLQQALRRLHVTIEGKTPEECAAAALQATHD